MRHQLPPGSRPLRQVVAPVPGADIQLRHDVQDWGLSRTGETAKAMSIRVVTAAWSKHPIFLWYDRFVQLAQKLFLRKGIAQSLPLGHRVAWYLLVSQFRQYI